MDDLILARRMTGTLRELAVPTLAMKLSSPFRPLVSRLFGASVLVVTLLAAPPANAGYTHSTTTVIEEVIVLHDGGFYFKVQDNVCGTAGNPKIAYAYKGVAINGITPDDTAMDRILRVGMAAQLSGATVQIYAEDGGSRWGCLLGAIKLR